MKCAFGGAKEEAAIRSANCTTILFSCRESPLLPPIYTRLSVIPNASAAEALAKEASEGSPSGCTNCSRLIHPGIKTVIGNPGTRDEGSRSCDHYVFLIRALITFSKVERKLILDLVLIIFYLCIFNHHELKVLT
jgi:hypothetical protein